MKWKDWFSKQEPEPESQSDQVAEALVGLKKSVDLFSQRLTYVEERVTSLADKVRAVQESKSPTEKTQNQYFKEVADLSQAMGPAFKGVMNACFTAPEETMRVNGHNSALRETLSHATDALLDIEDIKRDQVKLEGKTLELASRFKAVESNLMKPRLPKKSGKAN